jgi:HD-GYP domain-containing protein (c-di-GMP phosphodiesterase class II)
MVARGFLAMPEWIKVGFVSHCEVAQHLAERLGFGKSLLVALGQIYERWDGRGAPGGLKGETIALAVRIVTLAQDAVTFHRLGGHDAAVAVAHERTGTEYDPKIAECFCQNADRLLAGLADEPTWETVLPVEPGPQRQITEAELDNRCRAIADFADIKSPYTVGHSPGVAALASAAGRRAGLPGSDVMSLQRAGLLHDLGRVGASTGIWCKAGPLTSKEWESVRLSLLHRAYLGETGYARPLGSPGRASPRAA